MVVCGCCRVKTDSEKTSYYPLNTGQTPQKNDPNTDHFSEAQQFRCKSKLSLKVSFCGKINLIMSLKFQGACFYYCLASPMLNTWNHARFNLSRKGKLETATSPPTWQRSCLVISCLDIKRCKQFTCLLPGGTVNIWGDSGDSSQWFRLTRLG